MTAKSRLATTLALAVALLLVGDVARAETFQAADAGTYRLGIDGVPTRVWMPGPPMAPSAPPGGMRRRPPPSPQFVLQDGLRVTTVYAGYPATRLKDPSGKTWTLVRGDVLLTVNGKRVRDVDSLRAALADCEGRASLALYDPQGPGRVALYDAEWPEGRPPSVADSPLPPAIEPTKFTGPYLLGITGQPTRISLRQKIYAAPPGGQRRRPIQEFTTVTKEGVSIAQVTPGSMATRLTDGNGRRWFLEHGDVILSIDGRAVGDVESLRAALADCEGKAQLEVCNPRDPDTIWYFTADWR
jgi:S1-C subfamily serine protease